MYSEKEFINASKNVFDNKIKSLTLTLENKFKINLTDTKKSGYLPLIQYKLDDVDNKDCYILLQSVTNKPLAKVTFAFTGQGFEFTSTIYETDEDRTQAIYEMFAHKEKNISNEVKTKISMNYIEIEE